MMLNLRSKLAATLGILLIVTQIATLGIVMRTMKTEMQEQALRSAEKTADIYTGIANSQAGLARATLETLASDQNLRTAIAGRDTTAIKSALETQTNRPGAGIAFLFDADYRLLTLTGTPEVPLEKLSSELEPVGSSQSIPTILMVDDAPYFIITVPVGNPSPVAWMSVGYILGDYYIKRTEEMVGMNVSLFATYNTGVDLLATSLPAELHKTAETMFSASLDNSKLLSPEIIDLGGTELIAVRRPMLRNQQLLQVLVTQPLDEAMATYSLIHRMSVFLTWLLLAAALTGGFLLSRSLTKPIAELVNAAKRIQTGVYNQTLNIDLSDELSEFAVAFNSMQKEISAREARIAHQAKHDGLTGLHNREFAVERLAAAINLAAASNEAVAVMIVSLNARQELSGSLGNEIADTYLKKVANQIRSFVNQDFTVARLELDTFLIVMPGVNSEAAAGLGHDLVAHFARGIELPNINISVNTRIGIAVYPEHGTTRESLLLRATIAKSEGNINARPVRLYREGDEEQRVRNRALLHDLRKAVKENKLVMYYQPKIRMDNETIYGVEALIRWDHPTYGWLPPGDFIPIIEQSGNISMLTRWAIKTIARQYQQWRKEGLDLYLAVNLSAHDMQDTQLPWFILDTLSEFDCPPGKLTVEITEQAMVQDFRNVADVLAQLRNNGIRVSIDDFGTGYSSLSQLRKLEVDELKIDRTFVARLPEDSADAAIVSTAIDLAHKLNLAVVAEGVTSGAACRWLQAHGIDQAQGYYWSKPIPAAEIILWANNFRGGSTRFAQTLELIRN